MQLKRAKLILSGKPISIWFRHPNAFGVSLQDVAAKWLEDGQKFAKVVQETGIADLIKSQKK